MNEIGVINLYGYRHYENPDGKFPYIIEHIP